MPHISLRTEKLARDGHKVAAPEGLAVRGPLLPAILTQPSALVSAGQAPSSIHGVALIDTGATTTCFDLSSAQEIELPVSDVGSITSVSHVVHNVPAYSGKLVVPGFSDLEIEKAFGVQLQKFRNKVDDSPPLVALIGRDVLLRGVLIYHGVDGFVSLSL